MGIEYAFKSSVPDVDWLGLHCWLVATIMEVVEVALHYDENDGDDGYHQMNYGNIVNGLNNIHGHHWNDCMYGDCDGDYHLCSPWINTKQNKL